jgi:ABC transporter substrate binding protein (PQQ-dependent alcohol dehydrogenase system)
VRVRGAVRAAARASLCLTACLGALVGLISPMVAAASTEQQDAPDIRILYLGKAYPEAEPLSLQQTVAPEAGVVGAQLAVEEINVTGAFVGRHFAMDVDRLPKDAAIGEEAASRLGRYAAVVADLSSADLLALADLPEAEATLILDIRTTDDDLREERCRANVFHVLPSRAMRTDAIAQYLIWKQWRRWFLLRGNSPDDLAYAADVRRAAARFGGSIVEEREYAYNPGARRVDTGYQQVQTQMPMATAHVRDYDVVFVADADQTFGDYLPYNTADPRPIVGTQGLVAAAWHPAFQEYSALQMQHRFDLAAHRGMTERDYAGWLALRIVGEAVLRSQKTDPVGLRDFLRSDSFKVAGFKGEGLTFRRWDQQLRQPILLAGPLMVVSMSPQEGFLHRKVNTDTLGYDEPESKCHLSP